LLKAALSANGQVSVMNEKKYIILILATVANSVLAYNGGHGPFPDEAKVERATLTELSHESASTNTISNPRYTFPIQGQKESRLNVVRKPDAWFAEIVVGGKTVMQPSAFSPYGSAGGLTVYTTDLNRDEVADFVIYSFSGGCGLACGHCNVAFILSSGQQYSLTTVTTLFPDQTDFILVDRKPHFIHTSFLGVDKCNDGKHHNFWIYNLLAFGKDGLDVNNTAHAAFPKTIWYTFKPNHTETSIITDEQKATLRQNSLTCVYWKEEEIHNKSVQATK
jgi:hypothetical protein